MLVSQKMNNSLVTNEKGVQDKEAAKNSDSAKTSKTMMYIMPLMSLWIGFTIPGAMSVYWLAQGLLGMFVDMALTKHYRKKYDAEDASKLRLAMEEEERQMEKERIRAERRAANPEGITQNTSKKKLQENKRKEQEAEKAAAAREYAEKRGIVFEEEKENLPLSGVKDRPFCKGRAYDPDRYTKTEEE
jgi:YidC/Oxa1 family membrane protein insertase